MDKKLGGEEMEDKRTSLSRPFSGISVIDERRNDDLEKQVISKGSQK